MIIERVTIRHLAIPLQHYFRTSFGSITEQHTVILEAHSNGLTGYGEATPFLRPVYSYETIGTVLHVLRDFILAVVVGTNFETAEQLIGHLAFIRGHNFAKSSIELAFWDLLAQREGRSLASLLGGVRDLVEVGASIGIQETPQQLLERIELFLGQGYRRIKIKVEPGWDVNIIEIVRKSFPEIPLMVDANGSYRLGDAEYLRQLDEFDLLMIEQPLAFDDIVDHARLRPLLQTPICLDESIRSPDDARKAIELGSCDIINIKPGRVGGLANSVKIHDICQDNGVANWVGGMGETGIGQYSKIVLASLPNFTQPNDIEPSSRFYVEDVVEPEISLEPGSVVKVPKQSIGDWRPSPDRLSKYTIQSYVYPS